MLKSRLLQRLAHRIERWMLRRFDNVSSISHRMVERLVTKGVAKERTRFFPNWVDISHVGPFCSGERYRKEFGIPVDATVVLYSGTLGAKQGLHVIPQIAERLARRRDILMVVCGEGAMKSELQARTQTLSNVRLLPLQPFERLGELLSMADIHLLPQGAEGADLMLPSKLSGMLASGRPVVATCGQGTELASVVSQCGLIAAPENAEQATAAILRLVDDSKLRAALGQRARAWAEENLDRDATLGRVFASLDSGKIPVPAVEQQPVALPEES
jgi:colanic acid biosynthesis glycosyl transferase WcaI